MNPAGRRGRRSRPAAAGAASEPSWRLVLIADLQQRVEQQRLAAQRLLGVDLHADMPEGAIATLQPDDVSELKRAATKLAEYAEQLRDLADSLPDAPIVASVRKARLSAVAELATGTIDVDRATLAARVATVGSGFPALADCIRVIDVSDAWGEQSPRDLLRLFRGADAQTIEHVLVEADIPQEARFAELRRPDLTRLAASILAAARGDC